MALPLEVTTLRADRRSLTEVLELPPDRALISVLEGPDDGLGLIIVSPPVVSGMIEMLTMGRVAAAAPALRKPTRTDAAMIAPVIDAALAGLEAALAQEADLVWAGGFRYASFLDDPRPLALLLEDVAYRVLTAEVTLAHGPRSGEVLLVLPAEGRGLSPQNRHLADEDMASGPAFTAALAAQVQVSGCQLTAVLDRLTLPVATVMGLKPGDVLTLPRAALDRIGFEGLDGRRVAEGKLGQNRGLRAVRLTPAAEAPGQGGAVLPFPAARAG